ncbi:MAG: hypothetical protein P1V18_06300 [Candidatus Gracilibacteria bacterium]|nr:hypothetical protein [Candidatus Gracilibacteria bacterium]
MGLEHLPDFQEESLPIEEQQIERASLRSRVFNNMGTYISMFGVVLLVASLNDLGPRIKTGMADFFGGDDISLRDKKSDVEASLPVSKYVGSTHGEHFGISPAVSLFDVLDAPDACNRQFRSLYGGVLAKDSVLVLSKDSDPLENFSPKKDLSRSEVPSFVKMNTRDIVFDDLPIDLTADSAALLQGFRRRFKNNLMVNSLGYSIQELNDFVGAYHDPSKHGAVAPRQSFPKDVFNGSVVTGEYRQSSPAALWRK